MQKAEKFTVYSRNEIKRHALGTNPRIKGRTSMNHKQEKSTGQPRSNSQCATAAWSRATHTREAGDI